MVTAAALYRAFNQGYFDGGGGGAMKPPEVDAPAGSYLAQLNQVYSLGYAYGSSDRASGTFNPNSSATAWQRYLAGK